jgi:hypothetical protein
VKYQPPYGTTDPNAPYINGDPSQGREGSIPPAAAFEQPMREIVGVISKSGLTPSDNDLLQLTIGVRSQRLNYAVDTNPTPNPNALTVAYDPPILAYEEGLTLHVRVKSTNVDGQVSINAGPGRVPVRRMNNSDLAAGDLPIGCIATLIYDGLSAFQLSNYGGAGGDTTIQQVNVPYVNDTSAQAGVIVARYDLAGINVPLPLVAGNIIAVRVAFTSPGATVMYINEAAPGATPYPLLPNGGGIMLQGDIVADDVVQFFYDGVNLRFTPNAEINAAVTYVVGAGGTGINPPTNVGGQFATMDDALNALKRKNIGANGYVTLRMTQGTFQGPIDIAHPSADRLRIEGSMLLANPIAGQFQVTGNSAAARAADAIYNEGYLRSRFGTVIEAPDTGGEDHGIANTGAGRLTIADLLVVGDQPPTGTNPVWWQAGVYVPAGLALVCVNVTAFGVQGGFNAAGSIVAAGCFASACSYLGFQSASSMTTRSCGAFGNAVHGFAGVFASLNSYDDVARGNGQYGVWIVNRSGLIAYYLTVNTNGVYNLEASVSSTIMLVGPVGIYTPTNPPPDGTLGNGNSSIQVVAPTP